MYSMKFEDAPHLKNIYEKVMVAFRIYAETVGKFLEEKKIPYEIMELPIPGVRVSPDDIPKELLPEFDKMLDKHWKEIIEPAYKACGIEEIGKPKIILQ